MPIYLMDKSYRVNATGGIPANRIVVQGPADGECTLPAGPNAPGILGVTVHSQTENGRMVSVRKAGIAEVTAAGPIAVGTPVNIHSASGKVKAVAEMADTKVHCLGFAETASTGDGDIIEVFISIHQRTT